MNGKRDGDGADDNDDGDNAPDDDCKGENIRIMMRRVMIVEMLFMIRWR